VVGHPESAGWARCVTSRTCGDGPAIDEPILDLCPLDGGYYLAPLGRSSAFGASARRAGHCLTPHPS